MPVFGNPDSSVFDNDAIKWVPVRLPTREAPACRCPYPPRVPAFLTEGDVSAAASQRAGRIRLSLGQRHRPVQSS